MRVVPRKDVLSQAVLLSKEGGGEPEENKVDNQTGSEDCGDQNLQGVGSLQAVLLEGAGDSNEHDTGCSPGRRGVMQSLQDGGSFRVDLLEGEGNSEGQGGGSPQVVLLAGEGHSEECDAKQSLLGGGSLTGRLCLQELSVSNFYRPNEGAGFYRSGPSGGSQVSGGAPYSPCWGQWTRGTE